MTVETVTRGNSPYDETFDENQQPPFLIAYAASDSGSSFRSSLRPLSSYHGSRLLFFRTTVCFVDSLADDEAI